VAGEQSCEDGAPNRSQALTALGTARLGDGHRVIQALFVVVIGIWKDWPGSSDTGHYATLAASGGNMVLCNAAFIVASQHRHAHIEGTQIISKGKDASDFAYDPS
jgi:hypothetical protein